MNRVDIYLETMISLEGTFKCFPSLMIHPKCLEEIKGFLEKCDKKDDFATKLIKNLNILCLLKHTATSTPNFKLLKGTNGLCRFPLNIGKNNYRVIYFITKNNEVLLHIFFERGGKKSSDYKTAVPTAQERLKELTKR